MLIVSSGNIAICAIIGCHVFVGWFECFLKGQYLFFGINLAMEDTGAKPPIKENYI